MKRSRLQGTSYRQDALAPQARRKLVNCNFNVHSFEGSKALEQFATTTNENTRGCVFLIPRMFLDYTVCNSNDTAAFRAEIPLENPGFKAKVIRSVASFTVPGTHAWQLCADETAAITINNRCKFAGAGSGELRFQFRTLTPFVIESVQNSNAAMISADDFRHIFAG